MILKSNSDNGNVIGNHIYVYSSPFTNQAYIGDVDGEKVPPNHHCVADGLKIIDIDMFIVIQKIPLAKFSAHAFYD